MHDFVAFFYVFYVCFLIVHGVLRIHFTLDTEEN